MSSTKAREYLSDVKSSLRQMVRADVKIIVGQKGCMKITLITSQEETKGTGRGYRKVTK